MSHTIPSPSLPTWAEQMRALEPVVDNLLALWRPDGATEAEVQDMNKLALSMLARGTGAACTQTPSGQCSCRCGTTPTTRVDPTPTTCTRRPRSMPAGTYRISGFRGTARFVEITEQTWDFLSPSLISRGGTVFAHDLDSLTLAEDGSFSVILSPRATRGLRG